MASLSGKTVLDCSILLPGALAGKLLAEKGARVLKIENPDRPDPAREMGSGAYYDDLNACKELIHLNLTRDKDRRRFAELAAGAHVVIEAFRPAAKLKLGLDEKTLLGLNPDLRILSLIGYPEDGPWRERAGHDLNFQAATGVLSLTRELPGLPLSDVLAAYEGALAVVASLASTEGRGERIVISMTEAITRAQSKLIAEFKRTGVAPSPGNTFMTGKYPCYQIHVAQDGRRIAFAPMEEKFWNQACALLGLSRLEGKGYATGEEGERIHRAIAEIFAARPWSHWAPLFEEADCCVSPVLTYPELYASPMQYGGLDGLQ